MVLSVSHLLSAQSRVIKNSFGAHSLVWTLAVFEAAVEKKKNEQTDYLQVAMFNQSCTLL